LKTCRKRGQAAALGEGAQQHTEERSALRKKTFRCGVVVTRWCLFVKGKKGTVKPAEKRRKEIISERNRKPSDYKSGRAALGSARPTGIKKKKKGGAPNAGGGRLFEFSPSCEGKEGGETQKKKPYYVAYVKRGEFAG